MMLCRSVDPLMKLFWGVFRNAGCTLFVAGLVSVGCGDSERTRQADTGPGTTRADAGVVADAGPAPDTGIAGGDAGSLDAQTPDSGPPLEVLIPAGQFTMGDMPTDEMERQIEITRPFMMQTAEVSQADWKRFFPDNPSATQDDTHPVEGISWYDALAYANALSTEQGLTPCYDLTDCTGTPGSKGFGGAYLCSDRLQFELTCTGYRLATEAEWEYAARLGLDETAECNGDADPNVAASQCGTQGYTTHPVRARNPDGTGLYDIRGNVAEWVWDWYDTYRGQNLVDPLGPSGLTLRVTRGGGWTFHARACRVSHRSPRYPSCQTDSVGLRLVRTAP